MSREEVVARVHRRIDERFEDHVERCRAFLRQPSVSATGEGMREAAAMVREMMEEVGATVRFEGTETHPIVYGRVGQGRRKNLIIYGMYDVMPVDPQKWTHPPFGASLWTHPKHGPCIVSRGAVNSKGALSGLFNAIRTIREVGKLPLDLTFVIDGEEEIGSPSFEPFVRAHSEELRGIGVADFDFSEDPKHNVTLHLGLKGIVYLELKCRGGKHGGPVEPQHSSASAWISSPVWRLVHALSLLVDERENITVDGFARQVAPLSDRDRALLDHLVPLFDEKSFLGEIKASRFKYVKSGADLLRKGLYSPIINIDGIHAGYTGPGTKTVLPRVATAKVDIRFGPNLEPEEVVRLVREHLDRRGFDDVEIIVKEAYTWSKTDVSDPLVQRLMRAYERHGRRPQVWPMATWAAPYFVFSRILRLPVVSGGLGYGNRPHSPDEYMTVEGLREFEKFVVTFLYELAA
jgi:acetylornithine deacetylase/succinyl-diaminopimelate desuccinylase-like protein